MDTDRTLHYVKGHPEIVARLDALKEEGLSVVSFDTCRLLGRERGRLRRQKKPIADFDLLIEATARQHDLTLLTNNRRHFELVEGLPPASQPQ